MTCAPSTTASSLDFTTSTCHANYQAYDLRSLNHRVLPGLHNSLQSRRAPPPSAHGLTTNDCTTNDCTAASHGLHKHLSRQLKCLCPFFLKRHANYQAYDLRSLNHRILPGLHNSLQSRRAPPPSAHGLHYQRLHRRLATIKPMTCTPSTTASSLNFTTAFDSRRTSPPSSPGLHDSLRTRRALVALP